MPHQIGFVASGSGKLAHQHMVATVRDFAVANGWTLLRFSDAGADHEVILRAPGLSGTEQIFVGLRTYQDAGADYYNLLAGVFTGYVAGNTFDTQPGAWLSGVPAHNNRIDYWLTLNGQRLVLAMKVGTPVYETCYLGKFLPYATPGQFPYPVVCAGPLNGAAATRFSEVNHSMPFKGAGPDGSQRPGMRLRTVGGLWIQPWCWPWGLINFSVQDIAGSVRALRDTAGNYPLLPLVMHDNSGVNNGTPSTVGSVFGELDGVFYISGFDNAVENTLVVDGRTHVVVQDCARTGHTDYVAIRMDV